MSIKNYLSGNKIGALILIIVIIIAFGFGGFGGGFLSNNQNNIVKIDNTNITTKDFVNYINRSGISQKAIQDNLNNNIIEELLSGLISETLLNLEVESFNILFSENSLSKKIRFNEKFHDEKGIFQRIKYEKFLLENNLSAPLFEQRLKNREVQKKLFDYIGAGTVSPNFFVDKLFDNENKKLNIDFIDLENFYKKDSQITDQELLNFIDENNDLLKIEFIDFKYSIINPQNLVGVKEFNQEFFDKIDEIENDILNGSDFSAIISKFDLEFRSIKEHRYSNDKNSIENKIYEVRNIDFDIIENKENFILYKIVNKEERKPDLQDSKTKNEIINLVNQKNKFEYNRKLLNKIKDKEFTESEFLDLGKENIESLTLNSIKDNNKFDINSIKMLYSLPANTFTLINDEKNKIYLAKIKKYDSLNIDKQTDLYKSYISKENTRLRKSILQSYDFFLNDKYKVNVNQLAIDNVKNLFQ